MSNEQDNDITEAHALAAKVMNLLTGETNNRGTTALGYVMANIIYQTGCDYDHAAVSVDRIAAFLIAILDGFYSDNVPRIKCSSLPTARGSAGDHALSDEQA